MLRMTRALPLLCTAVMALSVFVVWGAPEPTYPCLRVDSAPVIDGAVTGDPAWAAVPGVTGFYALGGGYTLAKQSTAYACHDAETLYLAVICEEPDIARVKSVMKDGDGLWSEDSVELFIEPARGGPAYQFVVSAGGAKTGAAAAADTEGWRAAAQRGDREYSIEVALPLAVFREQPNEGGWHIAFCRNIWTTDSGGDKFTSWPGLTSRFLEPEHYARLQFRDALASPELRDAAERTLNAGYRAELVAQVRALAPAAAQYLDVLKQAADDDTVPLQREARQSLLTWSRVGRLAGDASDAPMQQLREAAARSTSLRQESYELKYRYLLEKLLRGP